MENIAKKHNVTIDELQAGIKIFRRDRDAFFETYQRISKQAANCRKDSVHLPRFMHQLDIADAVREAVR